MPENNVWALIGRKEPMTEADWFELAERIRLELKPLLKSMAQTPLDRVPCLYGEFGVNEHGFSSDQPVVHEGGALLKVRGAWLCHHSRRYVEYFRYPGHLSESFVVGLSRSGKWVLVRFYYERPENSPDVARFVWASYVTLPHICSALGWKPYQLVGEINKIVLEWVFTRQRLSREAEDVQRRIELYRTVAKNIPK